jgi:hypothetical protein
VRRPVLSDQVGVQARPVRRASLVHVFFILIPSCWVESWDILGHAQRLHLRLVAYIEERKGLSALQRAILRPLVLIRVPSDSLNPAFASIIYQYSRKRFVVAKKLYKWSKNISH